MYLPPLQNINIIYVMEFPESQTIQNEQWKLIAKSKQKRYVHTNNHIIKPLEVSKL